MSKLGYPLTFHPSQPPALPIPSTSSSPTTLDDGKQIVSSEPVDTGLIQCICESTEDDGFTIQCDRCLTWQHAYCMNITQNTIPDRYLCDDCTQRLAILDGEASPQRPFAKQINPIKGAAPPATKRKEEKQKSPNGHNRSLSKTLYNPSIHKRPRDRPFQLDQPFTSDTVDTINKPTPKKPKLSKRISVSKRSLQRNLINVPLKKPSLKKKPLVKYQPTTTSTVKSKFVYEVIKETGERWKESSKWKSQPWRPHQPLTGPFVVMDAFGLASAPSITIQPMKSSSRKAAFTNTSLLPNTFLLEAHGEILLKSEYKFDVANDYSILGTPCAHVLFYPTLDLCVDGRRRGNDSRYFRRSCHPNAELRTMVINNDIRLGIFSRKAIEPGEEITLGWHWQKGHVSWRKNVEWVRQEQNRTVAHTTEQQEEERAGQDAMDAMLDRFNDEFGECACGDHDVCLIERLGQSNRQIIVHTSPMEENVDIDVISMSSPQQQQQKKDEDEELDIDGDIDIGDDELPPVKLASSVSSLSDDDDKKKPLRKLPCKKAWMQHYLQHTVKVEPDTLDEKIDQDTKQDIKESPVEDQAVEIDDGELSDASSASTIPLDEEDREWNLRVGPLHSTLSMDTTQPMDIVQPMDTTQSGDTTQPMDTVQPMDTTTKDTVQSRDTTAQSRDTAQPMDIVQPMDTTAKDTPQPRDTTAKDTTVQPMDTTAKNTTQPRDTTAKDTTAQPADLTNTTPPPSETCDEDPQRPKIKVSLQEYLLSRRAANNNNQETN